MLSTCEIQSGASCGFNDKVWTTKIAAQIYGKSERTIRRLAKDGVIEGYKIEGAFGPEWRIKPDPSALRKFESQEQMLTPIGLSHQQEFYTDKQLIAQLQSRIAEMEGRMRLQALPEESNSNYDFGDDKIYAIAELGEDDALVVPDSKRKENKVLHLWRSVRVILSRCCATLIPRVNSDEVA